MNRLFRAMLLAVLMMAVSGIEAGNRIRPDDDEIIHEDYPAEFIVVYVLDGKTAEYKVVHTLNTASAEDSESIFEFLEAEITPDSDLQNEIAEAIGADAAKITIRDRMVISKFADGSWYQDNMDGSFIIHDAAAGTTITYNQDGEPVSQRGSFTVMVKVYIDGKAYNYGEWATFKTMAEAQDAEKYVKYGEGKKEVRNWAMCEAGFPDTDDIRIVTSVVQN
ncbi:MAG: hypothetical protein PHQ23_03235 [Candidatus Wallbacteria bacterium]|nr:hypothetical protein [Candidatus Wallbacteria bacterium]